MSTTPLGFFAAAPVGMEDLLADELRALGAEQIQPARAGVSFAGELALAYRVCLWSRIASRVLLQLTRFSAKTPEELYAGIQAVDWDQHLAVDGTLAVDFNTARSRIAHSHFGALKVKDAVVDQFRDRFGSRPSVDVEQPHLRLNVYLLHNQAQLSLDLSGDSLHRRGYRERGVAAPLKENLAAAILLRSGWPDVARRGGGLVDPMCGSGTLPIEAAMIAGDIAPGLQRTYYGFLRWKQHDAEAWKALVDEALERREQGLANIPPIAGYDASPEAVRAAEANVRRADLTGQVRIERHDIGQAAPVGAAGLLVVNPPYGERIGARDGLHGLYAALGQRLRSEFGGWQVAVFTGNPALIQDTGLRWRDVSTLNNGPLECKLYQYDALPVAAPAAQQDPGPSAARPMSSGAEMFANRLRKNLKNLGRWARRDGVDCYRLYDADLPEYALAVDVYQGEQCWVHVQEYEAPKQIPLEKTQERLADAMAVIPQVLDISPAQVFLKVRRRQKGTAQYEKLAGSAEFHAVREGRCQLLVNFTDYLDTGLFLDHRITRGMIEDLAEDAAFLNLFAYTGSATVHAAMGGARRTTTVDMSATYLDWARRNMALNGFVDEAHEYVQADCLAWLREASSGPAVEQYELIFLDPPTFSNSKRMEGVFDVQRDHGELINHAARLLDDDGVIIFSTNFRRFKLDEQAFPHLRFDDITRSTIPPDFARNPKIHYCWMIRKKPRP